MEGEILTALLAAVHLFCSLRATAFLIIDLRLVPKVRLCGMGRSCLIPRIDVY